jgi:hypothetical protein
MRRLLTACAVLIVLAALPAGARAVTIQEFPISPGRGPTQVSPYYVKAGPDGNLWIVNRGSDNGILRVSPAGRAVFPPIEAGSPQDIAVGGSGAVYWTQSPSAPGGNGSIVRWTPGGIQRLNGLANPFGVAVNPYSIALTPGESIFTGVQVSSADGGANGIRAAAASTARSSSPATSPTTRR